jgi:glutamate formiminotransferase/formiminotetrahydrofolate cyclodeaminase
MTAVESSNLPLDDALPILECVANFSEGRNHQIILNIAEAITSIESVNLLHLDAGYDANRTVMTFAGSPAALVEAAFQAIRVAVFQIDMRSQQGTHPRIGATDVCPLVPISGISMNEAIDWARQLGARVGKELNIPVYLYEYAATQAQRANLAAIRHGEYEGLEKKMTDPSWKPDFGPTVFNAQAGATVIGARKFLIAYNVNLATSDVTIAKHIAQRVRESGYTLSDGQGKTQRVLGKCKAVKAIGWDMPEHGITQVSMNITDMDITSVHTAFEACKEVAAELGVRVTGSELIGLAPERVFLEAGTFFLQQKNQNKTTFTTKTDLLDAAVQSLGLADLAPFSINDRVLEYRLKAPALKAIDFLT